MLLRLEDIVKILKCKFICRFDKESFCSENKKLVKKYCDMHVLSINLENDRVVIELAMQKFPIAEECADEEWYKEHIKQFGSPPTFF